MTLITPLLSFLISNVNSILLIGAMATAGIGLFVNVKKSGKTQQVAADLEKQAGELANAHNVDIAQGQMGHAAAADDLREHWTTNP